MMNRMKISSLALITRHTEPQLTVSVNNYFTPPGVNKAKKDVTTHIMPVLNAPLSLKKNRKTI